MNAKNTLNQIKQKMLMPNALNATKLQKTEKKQKNYLVLEIWMDLFGLNLGVEIVEKNHKIFLFLLFLIHNEEGYLCKRT